MIHDEESSSPSVPVRVSNARAESALSPSTVESISEATLLANENSAETGRMRERRLACWPPCWASLTSSLLVSPPGIINSPVMVAAAHPSPAKGGAAESESSSGPLETMTGSVRWGREDVRLACLDGRLRDTPLPSPLLPHLSTLPLPHRSKLSLLHRLLHPLAAALPSRSISKASVDPPSW